MPEVFEKDAVEMAVLEVRDDDAAKSVTVRFAHKEFDQRREWSYVDLVLTVPLDTAVEPGDLVRVILHCTATKAECVDDMFYSCRVYASSQHPPFGYERTENTRHVGLIQREDPPNEGDIILHMGSGLTCYPILAAATGVAPERVEDGQFWEFHFPKLETLLFERV